MAIPDRYKHLDFTPPDDVAKHARQGLAWREEYGRGSTEVGINRGKQLDRQETLTPDDIKSMYSYFRRHEVDKDADDFSNEDNPSNGRIAWELWGGDPGYQWATKIHDAMEKADEEAKDGD